MQKHATEIVLTGGPCAGKTSALSYLKDKLTDRGYRVFVCPEVASLIILGGIHDMRNLSKNDPQKFFEVQCAIIDLQIKMRSTWNELARITPGDKKIIIYDRGPNDAMAYMGETAFHTMLERSKLTLAETRDSFEAVIHLQTTAIGAEAAYNLSNNAARHETVGEARVLDQKTAESWIGTPHLRVLDNSTDFEGKMERTLQEVCHVLGFPTPLEIERKFLLENIPDFENPELGRVVPVDIEQIYLSAKPGVTRRIRRRGDNKATMYFETTKYDVSPSIRQETERIITSKEYEYLKLFRDLTRRALRKTRHCFLWHNQYFELDIFNTGRRPLILLELELTKATQHFELPSFFGNMVDVTNDARFKNVEIAKI